MKEIPLTQGKVALVDDEDFERLGNFNWHAHKKRNAWYAERHIITDLGKRITLALHREILCLAHDDPHEGDHIDHDGLNCRRYNLRIVTHQENMWNRLNIKGWRRDRRKKTGKMFQAHIGCRKTSQCLGSYLTPFEAHLAYLVAKGRIGSIGEPHDFLTIGSEG